MTDYTRIKYTVDQRICTITLSRPEKHNALDDQMITELSAAFLSAQKDSNVKVIILCGEGDSFSSGADLAYSQRNRSASVRIPMYSSNPKAKRIEFRCPDPTCNPYIGFAALLMAGLDGIINKIDPGKPLDKDIYDMTPEQLRDVSSTPGSLGEALSALEDDHEFLLRGDVFSPDLIETWIEYKTVKEVQPMQLRPHPYEFMLYYDA